MLAVNGPFLFGVVWQVMLGNVFGNNPLSDTALVVTTVLVALFSAAFFNIRLEVLISTEGLRVRLFPFHIQYKAYPWSSIASAEIRTYSAMREFGGWGYRYGGRKAGNAFIIAGDKGLQLIFNNQKRLLIGTQQPEALQRVLKRLSRPGM